VSSSDLGIVATLPYVAPLRDRGWEITFITPEGPEVSKASARGYRWLPLHFRREMDLWGDAKASARLLGLFSRERFDIVHTHNFKVSLVGRVLASLARVPITLHTIHGITWSLESRPVSRHANAFLERVASLRTDLILSQSETDCRSFLESGVVPPEKIRVIGNGVELKRYDPARIDPGTRARIRGELGIGEREVVALFPGRTVREKGIEEVSLAASKLSGRVRVVFAGRDDAERKDPPSEDALRAARDAGALFLGHRADMPALYAAADIVGLASWREGMPRCLIEGAAMGKALVASNIRGCRDIVRDGVTGLLFEVKNVEELAQTLDRLAGDAPLRARLGTAGAADARERFDIDVVVARVVAAYDELLSRKGEA
jgi:glycosyltransferase involved in cell wall biosynthesis